MTRYEFYKKHFASDEEKLNNFSEEDVLWRLEVCEKLPKAAIITNRNIYTHEKGLLITIRDNHPI